VPSGWLQPGEIIMLFKVVEHFKGGDAAPSIAGFGNALVWPTLAQFSSGSAEEILDFAAFRD
jgi:hypothetical protein